MLLVHPKTGGIVWFYLKMSHLLGILFYILNQTLATNSPPRSPRQILVFFFLAGEMLFCCAEVIVKKDMNDLTAAGVVELSDNL